MLLRWGARDDTIASWRGSSFTISGFTNVPSYCVDLVRLGPSAPRLGINNFVIEVALKCYDFRFRSKYTLIGSCCWSPNVSVSCTSAVCITSRWDGFLDLNTWLVSPVIMNEWTVSAAALLTRDLNNPLLEGDISILRRAPPVYPYFEVFMESTSS